MTFFVSLVVYLTIGAVAIRFMHRYKVIPPLTEHDVDIACLTVLFWPLVILVVGWVKFGKWLLRFITDVPPKKNSDSAEK